MISVIILAAGKGVRFGPAPHPKQFSLAAGKPLFVHSILAYSQLEEVSKIYFVINKDWEEKFREILQKFGLLEKVFILHGGLTRRQSISNALEKIQDDGLVVLHNSVSPLTPANLIRECISAARKEGVVQAYFPAYHTIITIEDNKINKFISRKELGYTCDPTVYQTSILKKIMNRGEKKLLKSETTIDLAREMGIPIVLVKSEYDNIKVTTRLDLAVVERVMADKAF